MDWITKMNAAIAYIEAHLDGEIDVSEAGRIAGCSGYHFARVFSYMANTTLAEYIRRRRLTLAAFALQSGGEKVIDVALRYGYESPTSFTRAFAAMHGMPPSAAKQAGSAFVSYPPLSFQITIQGVHAMNYRIEKMEAFRVVGAKLETTSENDKQLTDIPRFWSEAAQNGKFPQILACMNKEPMGVFGICTNEGGNAFDYYIAVSSDMPAPEGLCDYTVPESTWAVFDCVGPMPSAMQALQRRIITEWLPNSAYELANAPDIEVYSDGNLQSAAYKSWVWLPVVKKG